MNHKLFSFLLLICLGLTQAIAFGSTLEINVSAAVSLKDAMLEIQKNYRQKQPDIKINFNFGSSGSLQTQIEQGAPVDLLISAAAKQMDALDKKSLLAKRTRRDLLGNDLVMIVLQDSQLNLKSLLELTRDDVKKIGIGAPQSVPAGQYALESLQKMGIWEKIKGKTVLGTDVRAVLTYVETGNVDAGLVYRTDALASHKVRIVTLVPAETHEPILYPAALLANAARPVEAADFLAYLAGSESKAVFQKFGFTVK